MSIISKQNTYRVEKVKRLLRNYATKYDGLGRPTLIVPVTGAKLTPNELEEQMLKQEAHVRRTKIETL